MGYKYVFLRREKGDLQREKESIPGHSYLMALNPTPQSFVLFYHPEIVWVWQ